MSSSAAPISTVERRQHRVKIAHLISKPSLISRTPVKATISTIHPVKQQGHHPSLLQYQFKNPQAFCVGQDGVFKKISNSNFLQVAKFAPSLDVLSGFFDDNDSP
jgi:hypothetical protein